MLYNDSLNNFIILGRWYLCITSCAKHEFFYTFILNLHIRFRIITTPKRYGMNSPCKDTMFQWAFAHCNRFDTRNTSTGTPLSRNFYFLLLFISFPVNRSIYSFKLIWSYSLSSAIRFWIYSLITFFILSYRISLYR